MSNQRNLRMSRLNGISEENPEIKRYSSKNAGKINRIYFDNESSKEQIVTNTSE